MSGFLSTWFREQGQNHPRGRRAGGRNSNRRALSDIDKYILRLRAEDRAAGIEPAPLCRELRDINGGKT